MGSASRVRVGWLTAVLTVLVTMLPGVLHAQTFGTGRGRVIEGATQRPLNGVQILIAGTTRGTLTGANGEYIVLNVPIGAVTVRAEMVGYSRAEQQVTVAANEAARADFALAQAAISLDQIIVTGTPGATTQRALGNSISKIDAAAITDRAPVTNLQELLMARTPGLTIMPGAGTVGTKGDIRIRGAGSLQAGNEPVFFVDGVRYGTTQQGSFGVSGQSRNPLDHLNPDDIESVEVIKGPAASTLYGSEAAAGVIQIITKRGRSGQQNVQWGGKIEYGTMDWALPTPTNYTICTAARIRAPASWPGCAAMDSLAPVSQRLLSRNTLDSDPNALRQGTERRIGLNARGGGERYSYYASLDRDMDEGVFYNNAVRRTAGRTNFQAMVTENIDVQFGGAYTRAADRLPLNDNASNGILRNAWRDLPGAAPAWQVGYRGLGSTIVNQYHNTLNSERSTFSLTTSFRPASWWSNRLIVGMDLNAGFAETKTAIDTTGRAPWGATAALGQVSRVSSRDYQYTVDYSGTITNRLNDNFSSALSVGSQFTMNRWNWLQGTGEGLVADNLNLMSAAAVTRSAESRSEQKSLGFYVQEQLTYQDRLYLTGALRVDDNSAFGREFTLAYYPKAMVSYIISEEPFFSLPVVDELKLRAAWGRAGNPPSPFSADRNLQATVVTFTDGTTGNALQTDAYGNPNLTSETGSEYEVGFDAALLAGRAGLEVNYYNQRTKSALVNVPVPPSSGFTGNQLQNIGEISNSGFELSLYGTPALQRNFAWDTRLSVSTNRNRLLSLGGREPILFGSFATVQRHTEGYPLGGYWYTETVRNADGSLPIVNGRAVESDTLYLGPSSPTRELSMANTFTLLGNLRLYVFADYKGGHYMWSAGEYVRTRTDQNSFFSNDPSISDEERLARRTGGNRYYFDPADFIKLREVSVSYSLPSAFAQRVGARSAAVTLAGRNLGIWTKYELGADPELNFAGQGTFVRTDYMSVPMLRRFVGSMTFSF